MATTVPAVFEEEGARVMPFDPIPQQIEDIAQQVVDAGFRVHTELGPGLLESAYEQCLAYELADRGLAVHRQIALPVRYREIELEGNYRIDLLVAECIIIEVKAVETLLPLHQSQLLTYLRMARLRLGFLMNFNVSLFKNGIKRMVS